jgi:hypothetical protein
MPLMFARLGENTSSAQGANAGGTGFLDSAKDARLGMTCRESGVEASATVNVSGLHLSLVLPLDKGRRSGAEMRQHFGCEALQ